jgi:hypothetical protein
MHRHLETGVHCIPDSREKKMTLHLEIVPVLSLVAGIAILLVPRLLNYIVAAYLILAGLAGLFG